MDAKLIISILKFGIKLYDTYEFVHPLAMLGCSAYTVTKSFCSLDREISRDYEVLSRDEFDNLDVTSRV